MVSAIRVSPRVTTKCLYCVNLNFSIKYGLYLHPFLDAHHLVSERSPIRSFAADCQLKKSRGFNLALIRLILSVFTTITLRYVSSLRCGLNVFTVFQQFDGCFLAHCCTSGLSHIGQSSISPVMSLCSKSSLIFLAPLRAPSYFYKEQTISSPCHMCGLGLPVRDTCPT